MTILNNLAVWRQATQTVEDMEFLLAQDIRKVLKRMGYSYQTNENQVPVSLELLGAQISLPRKMGALVLFVVALEQAGELCGFTNLDGGNDVLVSYEPAPELKGLGGTYVLNSQTANAHFGYWLKEHNRLWEEAISNELKRRERAKEQKQ